MQQRIAIIIGAGPAGLTAAYELLDRTDIKPIVYEMTGDIGGISKTVNYKGNRIDIGGHRFFSKSDRVMQWWQNIMPVQGKPSKDDIILEREIPLSQKPDAPDPEKTDRVMLIRGRLSRIFFLGKFFDYPVSLSFNTLSNLGIVRTVKIGISYLKARLLPIKNEQSLEDFFINRFGRELYLTFFKDYTEKLWGIGCDEISAEWGAQRIKGLSITKAVIHAVRDIFSKDSSIAQKKRETSLIKQFLYPKLGPGQMWEQVARIIRERGGQVHLNHKAIGFKYQDSKIIEVKVRDELSGNVTTKKGEYFFSTIPVKDLIQSLDGDVPENVQKVAEGLMYRDFVTVGLLVKKLMIKNDTKTKTINDIIPDSWVYIQEKKVKVGRVQIFNNWNPYMVNDENTVWVGMEYFCNEGDELSNKSDNDFTKLAIEEMAKIGFVGKEDVLDSTVIRMPKAYPAYFGSYDQFDVIKEFTNGFENLFLIGRNGMHKYNNADHSMLAAMIAVGNAKNNIKSKGNIWAVNTEEEYHEQR